jgi:phage shock protein A
MGIFTRVRDIIASNLNSMLDKAENPEKLVKLMIQEMENVLVDLKASCAGAMASQKRVIRAAEDGEARAENWDSKARLAVERNREDLAREALLEKRRYSERAEALKIESAEHEALVHQYKDEIAQLEEKLATVREKQRILIQRHIHAKRKKAAQENIRRMDSTDAFTRIDSLENRIDRMEAEADLVNPTRKPSLEEEFDNLEKDEELEKELDSIKSSVAKRGTNTGAAESTEG